MTLRPPHRIYDRIIAHNSYYLTIRGYRPLEMDLELARKKDCVIWERHIAR